MKRIFAFLLLSLFISPLFAAPLDTDWPVLAAQVKAGTITQPEAMAQAKAIHEAVVKGQELNQVGNYLGAVEATSLSHCKAWYELNLLRSTMGMVKDPDGGLWGVGDDLQTDKDGVITYTGDNIVECLKEVAKVKELIAQARQSAVPGPKTGPNTMDNCEAYVLKYEKYLKQ